jgi:hypothetical protein
LSDKQHGRQIDWLKRLSYLANLDHMADPIAKIRRGRHSPANCSRVRLQPDWADSAFLDHRHELYWQLRWDGAFLAWPSTIRRVRVAAPAPD